MVNQVFQKMIEYYHADAKRIQHFTKVFAYAGMIGAQEGMEEKELETLKIAALVHDIGIKEAERLYNSTSGKYQEELGPELAKDLLKSVGCEEDMIKRVCYLVGHHHTYTDIDGLDYQILVEADFIVNMYEDMCELDAMREVYDNIFKTQSGKKVYAEMFGIFD